MAPAASEDWWTRAPSAWAAYHGAAPHRLQLKCKIPLDKPPLVGVHAGLWVGERAQTRETAAPVRREDMELYLFVEPSESNWLAKSGDRVTLRGLRHVCVELNVSGISSELAKYLCSEDAQRGSDDGPARNAYEALGTRARALIRETTNRLLYKARNENGQYWIELLPGRVDSMSGDFSTWETRASIDGVVSFHWYPSTKGPHMVLVIPDKQLALSSEEWARAVAAEPARRTRIDPGELLSNAEKFRDEGQLRAAIVESDAALEHIVASYKQPLLRRARASGANAGKTLPQRLLRARFTEEEVPGEIIQSCVELSGLRDEMLHEGKPFDDQEVAARLIRSVRRLRGYLSAVLGPQA